MIWTQPEHFLLLILLIPLVVTMALRQRRSLRDLERFNWEGGTTLSRRLYLLKDFLSGSLFLSALTLLVLQTAAPARPRPKPGEVSHGVEILLVVDVSPSMLAADAPPSRLDVVKRAIFSAMPQWGGIPIGLVAFRGSASVLVPVGPNLATVRSMVNRLDPRMIGDSGSNLAEALRVGREALRLPTSARKLMIVFSDMEITGPAPDAELRQALLQGVEVLLVGVGSAEGTRVPTPNGGWVKAPDGSEWISRFGQQLWFRLTSIPGLEHYHLSQGTLGFAQRVQQLRSRDLFTALVSDSGSFLSWALLLLALSWIVRMVRWGKLF